MVGRLEACPDPANHLPIEMAKKNIRICNISDVVGRHEALPYQENHLPGEKYESKLCNISDVVGRHEALPYQEHHLPVKITRNDKWQNVNLLVSYPLTGIVMCSVWTGFVDNTKHVEIVTTVFSTFSLVLWYARSATTCWLPTSPPGHSPGHRLVTRSLSCCFACMV